MAICKSVLTSLLFCMLILHLPRSDETITGSDCAAACGYRCSKASRREECQRACQTCCHRCNCVPPGTSGNKEICPCYANMTTHGGRPKCP
ncbi:hypothetical protein NMG60_11016140 [Bertholletia excelsa]